MKQNYLKVNYTTRPKATPYDYKLVEHVLGYINPLPSGSTVLDLACGIDGFSEIFQKRGFTYTGVDIDNYQPDLNIFKVDIGNERFPFNDENFDIVFFKMAIEHLTIAEIGRCLSEIRRVLKPGAAVFIITPDWTWTYKIFYSEYTHQTPFTPLSLKTAMEMNGLECVLSQSTVQLPIVWQYPVLKIVCAVAQLFYPLFPKTKFIKFSRDRMVLGVGLKNKNQES